MWNVRVLKAASLICVSLKTLQPLAVIGNKKKCWEEGKCAQAVIPSSLCEELTCATGDEVANAFRFYCVLCSLCTEVKNRTGTEARTCMVLLFMQQFWTLLSAWGTGHPCVKFPPWRAWSVRLCRSSWAQLCKLQRGAQEQQRVQGTVETFTQEAGFNQNTHGKGSNEWMFVHLVEGEMRGGMETRQVYNCPLDWDFFNDSSLISAVLKEWD